MPFLLYSLVICLFLSPAYAGDALTELKEIIISEQVHLQQVDSTQEREGSSVVSKNQVLQEVMERISNCESSHYTSYRQDEGEISTYAFTCKIDSKELITSEVFVTQKNGRSEIINYQDMVMSTREMSVTEFNYIFLNSEIQTMPRIRSVSPGIRTLTTFAKVGMPVMLSFKTAKILSPVRTDWQKHFIAGAIISGATVLTTEGIVRAYAKKNNIIMSDFKIDLLTSLAGLVASAGAGVAKEAYDKYSGKGHPEVNDALYTAAGGLMVSATVSIPIELIFRSRNSRQKPRL